MLDSVKKKKIAIVTRKMITGGVENALLGMLKNMDLNKLEIDLYLEQLEGDLFNSIPEEVNIKKIPTVKDKKTYLLNHPIKYLESVISRLKVRIEKNYLKQCEISSKCLPIIDKHYDMAISYHAPNTVPVFYTINNLNADKKVLWLHGDLETNGAVCKDAYKYYKLYDKVFAVSNRVKKSFDDNYTDLAQKSDLFYNYIDEENLRDLSHRGESFLDDFLGTRILTIGRLDQQKGYDLAVEVCSKLKQEGYKIKWYVCGEGNDREKIENLISKYNLQDDFILLGNKINPYGYLKDCDIYVQTSLFEGYCTTTNEARVLYKPIVTTNVSGATEQFKNNKTGIITEISIDGIYKGIKLLLDNPKIKQKLSNNLEETLSNKKEDIDKLIKIL